MKYALRSLKRVANTTLNSPAFLHPNAKHLRRHGRYQRVERRSTSSNRHIAQPILESLLRKRAMSTEAAMPVPTSNLPLQPEDSTMPVKSSLQATGPRIPARYFDPIKALKLEQLACQKDVSHALKPIYPALARPSDLQSLPPTFKTRLCLALLLSAFQILMRSKNVSSEDPVPTNLPNPDSEEPGSYAWTLDQAMAIWTLVDPTVFKSTKELALYKLAGAQLLAFGGQLTEAEKEVDGQSGLKDGLGVDPAWLVLHTHQIIFLMSSLNHRPLVDALIPLLRKPHVWPFLTKSDSINNLYLTRKYGSHLRNQIFDAFDQLPDSHSWYTTIISEPTQPQDGGHVLGKDQYQRLGILLLHYFLDRMGTMDSANSPSTTRCNPANALLQTLDTLTGSRYGIPAQLKTQCALELGRFGHLQEAEELIKYMPETRYKASAMLALASRRGDVLQALDLVAFLQSSGSLEKRDIRQLLLAYNRAPVYEPPHNLYDPEGSDEQQPSQLEEVTAPDRINDAEEVFSELLAPHHPSKDDYSVILYAYARRGDVDKVNSWIQRMLDDGFMPDDIPWEGALKAFAVQGDVEGVVRMLDRLQSVALRREQTKQTEESSAVDQHRWSKVMNIEVFNILLELMAKRRDPLNANRLWRNVVLSGLVQPNISSVHKLMRAHAEAGHWSGVIKTWEYFETMEDASLSRAYPQKNARTTAIYNTVLRAHVSLGTPFATMMDLFHRMRTFEVVPDSFTYTMLIISACDSRDMETAMALFREMEEQEANKGLSPSGARTIDYRPIYALTYLFWGYLRVRRWYDARAVYHSIQQRGLTLIPLTYAVIVKSYTIPGARGHGDEGLKVAESFLSSLKSGWGDSRRGEGSLKKQRPPHHVATYSPLMADFVRQRKPEEVERMYEQMLQLGGEASIVGLTTLMDVYRRTGDVDRVRKTWKVVFEMAMEEVEKDELARQVASTPKNNVGSSESGADIGSQPVNYYRSSRGLLCYPFSILMDAVSTVGSHDEVALEWKRLKDAGFSFDAHNWNHLVVVLVRAGELERAFEVVESVIIPFSLGSKQLVSGRRMPWETSGTKADDEMEGQPLVDDEKVEWGRRRVAMKFEEDPKRRVALEMLAQEQLVNGNEAVSPDFVHELSLMQKISRNWYQWKPHKTVLKTLSKVLQHLESGRLVQPVLPPGVYRVDEDDSERAHAMLERLLRKYPRTCKLAYDQFPGR
ncbi:hypothetical protein M408DRAFT_330883 [Serendipita vermifera MAFF 305830]|uniref:Pentacotripeptide-repeat region of PRORP domain-containing protein n=1 Tax=Serendipita vermifera MAFF 305830 TaxID=933852 RepID=A0A0C2WHL7_SERVB|nr:hypothetical protein M408DRAFT_330883 [Serendipita vermifera MAFF 305830]